MSKVAVVKCGNYEYTEVKRAVSRAVELLGGIGLFASAGEKILLKPNMLSADPPEKCSTTNPAVFKAVAGIFLEAGAAVSYGDSPGFHSPEAAAKKTGMEQVASELGIKLADFKSGKEIVYNEGRQNKKFVIANGVLKSDGVVSLPKLKAHGLARMTGCIKNQFGCVPGALKGEFHVRIPNALDFCKMLVDLNAFVKPRLYVMDAVVAMEGNGPRSGNPKQLGVILASADPVALDAIVCRIIDLNPEFVPTIKYGREAGMGSYEDIELVGDDIGEFIDKRFRITREEVKPFKQGGLINFLRNTIVPKPYIISEKCIKCGVCVNVCPVKGKAVDWFDGNRANPPSYDYKKCIRCYCCQELCPEGAIELKVPFARRLFSKGK